MIYQYKCYACKNITEKITNDYKLKHTICKVCGAQATKIISLTAERNSAWEKECRR